MVRRILHVFCLCLILYGISFANLNENFENYPTGTFPSSGGWVLVYNGYGTAYQFVTDDTSFSGSKSLKLEGRSNWSANVVYQLQSFPDEICLEAYIKTKKLEDSVMKYNEAHIGFYNKDADTWGRKYAEIKFSWDNKIYLGGDGAPQYVALQSWFPDRWYKVKIKYNEKTRTASAWIDDELKASDIKVSDRSGTYNSIVLMGGNDTHTRAWFDDIKVFSESPGESAPQKVDLISISGETSNITPTFQWEEESSATWYQLFVENGDGNKIHSKWYKSVELCANRICSTKLSFELHNDDYIWWVRAWNTNGNGPWSSGMNFSISSSGSSSPPVAATLVSPDTSVSNPITYTWNAVPDSTWYQLWVDDSTGNKIKKWYTAAQANCETGSTCSVINSTTLTGNSTWWLQTYNDLGYGDWSSGMSFTVDEGIAPNTATFVSPSGTVTDTTPTYTWNAVSNATWYYLWVNDSTGNAIKQWYTSEEANCESGTGICSITPSTALDTGSGEWWVQTWNDNGYGDWSDKCSFLIVSDSSIPENIILEKTQNIDEQGGTISISNTDSPIYGTLIEIPSNAVTEDFKLEIGSSTEKLHENELGTPAGNPVFFGPAGSIFYKELEITIPYEEELIPDGMDEEDLAVYFWDGDNLSPTGANFVNTQNNTISFGTSHFSTFLPFLPNENKPIVDWFTVNKTNFNLTNIKTRAAIERKLSDLKFEAKISDKNGLSDIAHCWIEFEIISVIGKMQSQIIEEYKKIFLGNAADIWGEAGEQAAELMEPLYNRTRLKNGILHPMFDQKTMNGGIETGDLEENDGTYTFTLRKEILANLLSASTDDFITRFIAQVQVRDKKGNGGASSKIPINITFTGQHQFDIDPDSIYPENGQIITDFGNGPCFKWTIPRVENISSPGATLYIGKNKNVYDEGKSLYQIGTETRADEDEESPIFCSDDTNPVGGFSGVDCIAGFSTYRTGTTNNGDKIKIELPEGMYYWGVAIEGSKGGDVEKLMNELYDGLKIFSDLSFESGPDLLRKEDTPKSILSNEDTNTPVYQFFIGDMPETSITSPSSNGFFIDQGSTITLSFKGSDKSSSIKGYWYWDSMSTEKKFKKETWRTVEEITVQAPVNESSFTVFVQAQDEHGILDQTPAERKFYFNDNSSECIGDYWVEGSPLEHDYSYKYLLKVCSPLSITRGELDLSKEYPVLIGDSYATWVVELNDIPGGIDINDVIKIEASILGRNIGSGNTGHEFYMFMKDYSYSSDTERLETSLDTKNIVIESKHDDRADAEILGYLENDNLILHLKGTSGKKAEIRSMWVELTTAEGTVPTAELTSNSTVTVDDTYYFMVSYRDNVAVDSSTLGNDDVRVSGPNNYSEVATLSYKTGSSGGGPISGIYTIPAPGGSWDSTDNGAYTIKMRPGGVSDTSNNYVTAGDLGTFTVNMAEEGTSPTVLKYFITNDSYWDCNTFYQDFVCPEGVICTLLPPPEDQRHFYSTDTIYVVTTIQNFDTGDLFYIKWISPNGQSLKTYGEEGPQGCVKISVEAKDLPGWTLEFYDQNDNLYFSDEIEVEWLN